MATDPIAARQPQDEPDSYVGLAADDAERRATERGWSMVRALPPGAVITMEYRVGRLNFTVQGGRVIRCWSG